MSEGYGKTPAARKVDKVRVRLKDLETRKQRQTREWNGNGEKRNTAATMAAEERN